MVIDTAPYLGLLTINALVAAEHILVPVSCEYLPILGLKLFGETLARIRARLGARCEVLGYLLTMYDRRETHHRPRSRRSCAATSATPSSPTPIRVNTRHKAAPSHRKTIYEFEAQERQGARATTRSSSTACSHRLDDRARSGERLPQVVDDVPSVLDSHR